MHEIRIRVSRAKGSQSVGMMAAYGDHPVIRATFDEASQALGRDLWQLVTDGPVEELNADSQYAAADADCRDCRLAPLAGDGRAAMPTMVAGHSLGEYSALVAAGAIDFADARAAGGLRAQAMQDAVAGRGRRHGGRSSGWMSRR